MTTHTPNTARLAIAGVALLGATGAANASLPDPLPQGVHTSSRAVQIGPGFNDTTGDLNDTHPSGTALSHALQSALQTTVSADTLAEFGVLTNDLSFSGVLDGTSGNRVVRAFGESGFHDDTLLLDAPGFQIGDTVSVLASFNLDIPLALGFDALSEGGFGYLAFAYDFTLNIAGSSVSYSGEYFNQGFGAERIDGVDTPGTVTIALDIPVGEQFMIDAILTTEFEGRASNTAINAEFSTAGDTPSFTFLGWGGLPEGTALTSETGGFGTTPPVPSPASTALTLMSVACVAFRRRR